ncbi:MAG: hypothetical protein AAGC44_05855 [Planctomycetota bacterium]
MSPLTKAFVVLATILSVVMVTMTAAVVARVEDYGSQYRAVVDARDAAIKEATAEHAQREKRLADVEKSNENYVNDIAKLTTDLATSQANANNRGQEIADLLEVNARLTEAQASSAELNKTLSARINTLAQEVSSATTSVSDTQSKFEQATSELLEVKAELARLDIDYRRLLEENRALEARRASLENEIEGYQSAGIEYVPVIEEVDGAVTRVEQISDQLTLVQVNVGTRDKVVNDMQFRVFRGDEFVGNIKITRVDTDAAVGELLLGGGVRVGDRVQAGRR